MNRLQKMAPALTLVFMAPMLTEVLPGATRFSSIFVLPIEMCVWGGGALLIRAAVRKWNLGWISMLLMAIGLSIAEECLIQQTSFAPLVIRLKGVTYARSFSINYVYLTWALIYESVFVVFLPVYLVELIFSDRAGETWVSKAGLIITSIFFVLGSYLAWFSWTRIARPKVFHLPIYTPPAPAIITAFVVILILVFIAISVLKNKQYATTPLTPPLPWLLGLVGAVWAVLLYGIVLLAFGIAPNVSPLISVGIGLLLAVFALIFIPRFVVAPQWQSNYRFALIFGVLLGSWAISFVGFMGPATKDLYFKIITNIIAVVLMLVLGSNVAKRRAASSVSIA
ncbi:hypothetical protein [Mucilaginibacter agri]|uniref:Uncharacterized protein n=1 Tax=Mucilaginibacter agri TaxID=2695265 RepID=A0A965ZGB7_9SPHI|nr:hypothetical protein [Mucilaginibacter agri]NCD70470.1 hypothetical protein [Mucilaginibacter agri]